MPFLTDCRSLVVIALLLGHFACAQRLPSGTPASATTQAAAHTFNEAVSAQQHGDTATAIRLYRDLLRAHPEALPARINLGGLLVDTGHFDDAIAMYRAGLPFAPGAKELHLALAYALGRRGMPEDLKSAVAELVPLHRREPTDEQAAMLLADAYIRQDRFADALPLLAPLEHAHPDDRDIAWLTGSALIRSGRLVDGLRRVDAIAGATGDAAAYLLAGEARLDLQQFDRAREGAEAALARNPDIPQGQTLLGRALEHLGDYQAAETALRKGIAADPDDFQAHFYLGAILYFQRMLPEAEQHLRRALAIQADSAEARYKLALIEQANGVPEAALSDLRIVVAQRPQWLEAHAKLLALLYSLHRNDDAAREKIVVDQLKATSQRAPPQGPLP